MSADPVSVSLEIQLALAAAKALTGAFTSHNTDLETRDAKAFEAHGGRIVRHSDDPHVKRGSPQYYDAAGNRIGKKSARAIARSPYPQPRSPDYYPAPIIVGAGAAMSKDAWEKAQQAALDKWITRKNREKYYGTKPKKKRKLKGKAVGAASVIAILSGLYRRLNPPTPKQSPRPGSAADRAAAKVWAHQTRDAYQRARDAKRGKEEAARLNRAAKGGVADTRVWGGQATTVTGRPGAGGVQRIPKASTRLEPVHVTAKRMRVPAIPKASTTVAAASVPKASPWPATMENLVKLYLAERVASSLPRNNSRVLGLTEDQPSTVPSSYELPSSYTSTSDCRCPPKKKRSGRKPCRNPVTSRRTSTRGGRKYITVTRELKCRA